MLLRKIFFELNLSNLKSGLPPIWKDVYEENEQLYARWESLEAKETLVNKSETICGDIDPNFLVAAGKHSIRY